MLGHRFSEFKPDLQGDKNKFDELFNLFQQLLLMTSGNVTDAMAWMNQLDRQYSLTNDQYGIGDFFEDLKKKGYITEENQDGQFIMT
ncbi:MAG: hypothetical protein EAZ29_05790, partial [Runella slithyformis]